MTSSQREKAAPSIQRAIFLSMDTDWCHEEILQNALRLFRERELAGTIFLTGAYSCLSLESAGRFEIGVHPDFNNATLAGYESKLRELRALFPHAEGVASHAMMSSTPLLQLFKQTGFRYERNLLCYKLAEAWPFYHYNGLLRLPVFWEDDIWFTVEPGVRFSENLLAGGRTGLIFNFHPLHLFMNTSSQEHYQAFKPYQHQPQQLVRHRRTAYGALSFFEDLAAYIQKEKMASGCLRDFL